MSITDVRSEAAIETSRASAVDMRLEVVVIPEAEHELTLPGGTLAPEYERTLVDWIRKRSVDGG